MAASVDPAWKGLYKIGGIALILTPVLLVPELFLLFSSSSSTATAASITSPASNPLPFLAFIGIFVARDTLIIIGVLALYFALKDVNRAYALIGTVLAAVGTSSEIAVSPSLIYSRIALGNAYLASTTDAQRAAYVATGDLVSAANSAMVSLQALFFVFAIFLISLAMLKGTFPRAIAYLGMIFGAIGFVGGLSGGFGPPPFSTIGVLAIIGTATLIFIWAPVVGYKLYKFGR